MTTYGGSADLHANSGIPDHAFYEFAVRLSGNAWDIPLKIWQQSETLS